MQIITLAMIGARRAMENDPRLRENVLLKRLKEKGKVKRMPNKIDTIGAIDPDHYKQSEIEPIAVIEAWGLNFPLGSVIKYIARHRFSGTKRKDLIKAANYCYRAATGKWLPRELQEIDDGREDKTEGEGTCDVRKQRVRR